MRLAWRVVGMIGITAALACSGCGRSQKPTTSEPTVSSNVPLPEWAPKNPSAEFLRAARVLKPYAEERGAAPQDELSRRALHARYTRTLTAAWEFFGSLSDEQIERFLAARELQLPVKSLTKKQRAALYHYFDVYREVMRDVPPTDPEYGGDPLVQLYKFGAREDLSNVEAQFLVRASGIVAVLMRVRQPDGSLSPPLPVGLGRI